jgi:hypothetical protein
MANTTWIRTANHRQDHPSLEMNAMKTTLLILCLFTAAAALGQSSLSAASMTPSFQVADHPGRAAQQPATQEQSLLANNSITTAQGQMPLWEAIPEKHAAPLGDQARLLKKEHDTAKQSHVVWVN